MNLSYYIAKRYLFSKKSHNAINVISAVSVCGIAVATMALVCALSVFNGFSSIADKSFSAFDPELQIMAKEGKVFDPSGTAFDKVRSLPSVEFISESLEENALLKFEDRQEPVLLKGVSPDFVKLADMNSLIIDGEFALREGDVDFCVIGAGLASQMGVRAHFISPLEIYIPKRNERVNTFNPASAFTSADAYAAGVFALNQAKYDNSLLIVSIDLMRELLRYDREVSSLDIKIKDGYSVDRAQKEIKLLIGNEYAVKNRFEQQADIFKVVNVEKWFTFFILIVILMVAAFNVVSSLSMLIIDKQQDIVSLKNMGANNKLITSIFFIEGYFISFFGSLFGLIVGLGLCLIQQNFGIWKLNAVSGTFVIDAYPVVVQPLDILTIFIAVNIIGFLTVLYPVNNLKHKL